ncbi:LysR family transcriptional regulator [Mesorhizobium sp. M2D.F.Ca.ET.185.01.1.1]|uniref:LysR family transcriptional regulator n=1 Tax=unclassified Mesorhizobium TaxID=325217 RepID=UPI000FCA74EE|nr:MULTISPECIES: LysR family transcriptional regulator [unclassified Mesorhizobium]TGP55496.1 LysR family transcriptional regulator [bacterium M00.F.Ca.ET.230.01.1.1]TGP82642.1 LysR family transcriptional regulator [bacterium M00.F.Ca.ET.227.01.1.1]TGP94396.1 LysR family transcriptional regulator [bacterium M00.F.Ca.ET.221.01.1.1]TGP97850.1 LysR family transcriptional regulator [bacterium M00.F.Ca.ET.222.01.1.1]TGT75051.1 LysR family transcriptional regulator [bacterium M00.F.Ca.ET.159.01.1.1]
MDTLTRMRAFIDVVEAEGFSAAGRKIGRSKALLSKYVRELEDELGALLLNRTTRQFSLTEAGHTYYQRASEIVREVDSLAETVRQSSGDVRGRIKLSAARTFADAPIGQSLIDFTRQHPDIVLDIHLDDRFVDLVEEGFDLAVRISRLENSSLIARRLAPFSVRLCASPDLIAKHGAPTRPQDLANMPCIVDTNGRSLANWRFKGEGEESMSVAVSGPIEVNSPIVARAAALSGLGFAMLPDFIAAPDVASGKLVTALDDRLLSGTGIFAVYPHRRYLPAKVRVFVDFLVQWFRTRDTA